MLAAGLIRSKASCSTTSVKDDEPALLDYLATLIAKEYVLYNNPRASADDLAEELVRVLIRVRRHLPRRGVRPKRA
jgi:hypothetical protein